MVSSLLAYSDLRDEDYILYQTEEIRYRQIVYHGCVSKDFMPDGCQLITLERLFLNCYGESLNKRIYSLSDVKDCVRFLVEQTEPLSLRIQRWIIHCQRMWKHVCRT